MTIEKKNPNATAVSSTSNAIAAINDRHNRTETAAFGTDLVILFDSTSESLSAADLWGGRVITLTESSPSPTGACTLTVTGGSERGDFLIVNTMSQEVTVTISGQSVTAPTIPPKSGHASLTGMEGQEAYLRCDGTNIRWAGVPSFVMSDAEYTALATKDARATYITLT